MKSLIDAIIRSASPEPTPAEFFAERARLAAAVDDLTKQHRDAEQAVDAVLGTAPSKGTPAKLAAARSNLAATSELRDRAVEELAAHDQGFQRAADRLVRAIVAGRIACLEELGAAVADHLTVISGDGVGLDPNQREERRQNIAGVVARANQIRAERERHWPVLLFMDHPSIEGFMAELESYQSELSACQARLVAIREIRAGQRPLSSSLDEFCHARAKPAPAKRLNPDFEPPESPSAFANRRMARIEMYERACALAAKDGVSRSELAELGGVRHPDRDPSFQRRLGTPA